MTKRGPLPTPPRIVAMIIARMGSTRLPGKSLVEIAGRPLLDHMIEIGRHIARADAIAVVTSSLPADDPIVALAAARGVTVVRGHPDYVLDRIHQASGELAADVIVYVGGDCPLLDPVIVDRGIEAFLARDCDYLNNYEPPTFPEGMDVNVITRAAVEAAYARAIAPSQRIHAFSYLTRHPDEFALANFEHATDLSAHHWSLDFPDDLAFIRAVYQELHAPGRIIGMGEVLALIAANPTIAAMDRALQRGPVAHAFWNSPGIMRDMTADISELAAKAAEAIAAGDRPLSRRCFEEIGRIAGELARFAA
jgi:spore coat polysaccharide biosynthesis protein SpsF (cytidylyltransferase family)